MKQQQSRAGKPISGLSRLWRADPARSRNQGRFGLGLAIAKRHAELLGGRLEVDSELGRGSIFSLTFEAAGN